MTASSVSDGTPPPTMPFMRFLVAGGIAATVNIAARIGLNQAMPYAAAIVPAYLCGMAVAFALNRRFVFAGAAGRAGRQLRRFALVNAASLAQVWLVGVGLARLAPTLHWHWRPDLVAHTLAVLTPVVTSYFAHKHFSFAGETVLMPGEASGPF